MDMLTAVVCINARIYNFVAAQKLSETLQGILEQVHNSGEMEMGVGKHKDSHEPRFEKRGLPAWVHEGQRKFIC